MATAEIVAAIFALFVCVPVGGILLARAFRNGAITDETTKRIVIVVLVIMGIQLLLPFVLRGIGLLLP